MATRLATGQNKYWIYLLLHITIFQKVLKLFSKKIQKYVR